VLAEKAVLPPFGVCGGFAGARNRFWVRRDGAAIAPSALPGKVSAFPIEPGDVLMMESSGGGGFGDPLERDPAAVAQDVSEGYVTREAATATYGVVWAATAIDAAATAAKRSALRAARARVRVRASADLDDAGERSIRLAQETAQGLGVGVGAIVELVNPHGAPLRAWVAAVIPGNGHRAEVAAPALGILGVADGSEVELRAVHSGVLGLPVS